MKSTLIFGLAALSSQAVDAFTPLMLHYQDRMKMQLGGGVVDIETPSGRHHRGGSTSFGIQADNSTVSAETIELPLDHFGYDKSKTFKNRYWVYTKAYKPGGPVFIYDGGEGDAGPYAERLLSRNTSFFNQLVTQFNGIGIVWEHRFYGASTPVNLSIATHEDLKHHTSEQALADVPVLAKSFKRPELGSQDLTPKGTPWVFVGGSYPGMRASFMRTKYPDVIYASWASSAPTEARIDMGVYFEQVSRGLNKWGFGNCTKNIATALNYIDAELGAKSTSRQDAIKKLLLGPGAEKNPKGNIADALSMIFWNWQSYGLEGEPSLRSFCDWISTDEEGKTAPAQGWSGTKDKKWIAQRWASWKDWTNTVNTFAETNCVGPQGNSTTSTEGEGEANCDLTGLAKDPSMIAWSWQYCTEWGYYQQANFGPNRIVSRYNTLEHQQNFCNRQFAGAVKAGVFPKAPRVRRTNAIFGGWDARPSNVFWTGGEFDPWRTLSPLSVENFSKKFKVTQEIPKCGKSTNKSTIFGYLLKDACHCWDMNPTFPGSAAPRALFNESLKKWLQCWRPGGNYPGNGRY